MLTSRRVAVLAAATLAGVAGCSTTHHPDAAASTPDRSASRSALPAAASGAGQTPAGFAATSVTWVSPDEAFVLGTTPCAHAPCTAVVRTTNRGMTWTRLSAPAEPVGSAETQGSAPVLWGIRFATPEHGFAFGGGLWETTDGGRRWVRDAGQTPAGSILSLVIVSGQVLAEFTLCRAAGRCDQGLLERRALRGGPWSFVAAGAEIRLVDPDDLIATQARVAAVVVGGDVLVTLDGGLTRTLNQIPCPSRFQVQAPSVAVISGSDLALLCAGQGYGGHTSKQVYLSDDDGGYWTLAGPPSPDGDAGTIAATGAGRLAIATASAASWLFYSRQTGTGWRIVSQQDDGGDGWADLGFTTDTDGVVVYGPADTDGNTDHRPGLLLLTDDGGAVWRPVSPLP